MNTKEGNTDAKYTIKVRTTMIEPGYNVGVMRKPASLEADVEIFETANPGKMVCKLRITRVVAATTKINGVGLDFDNGTRISETYVKLGKSLAKYMRKKIK